MDWSRFKEITARFRGLRIAVVGDFCLDRYLEIDPGREEISIETGLPVRNVANVRSQPGGAGTILSNLLALGVGRVIPVGFCGEDGEGWELIRALNALPGVDTDRFFQTADRRTFTYTKPLLMHPGKPPEELNRLDFKNWSPTPGDVEQRLIGSLRRLAGSVDAVILLDQVDVPDTGVITTGVLQAVGEIAAERTELPILADSRNGLARFPAVTFKMNAAELRRLLGRTEPLPEIEIEAAAIELAGRNRKPVFVTLAEKGILGVSTEGRVDRVPSHPVRGEIDIVGAGDAVTANLAAALAAGATNPEAMQLAMAAASIVVHKLGTTGTASVDEIERAIEPRNVGESSDDGGRPGNRAN